MWGKEMREAERVSQRAVSQEHLPSVVNIPLTGVARTRRLWGDGGEGRGHEKMGDWTTEREQYTPRKM